MAAQKRLSEVHYRMLGRLRAGKMWNELTRRQQRILIKLFGGGSLRGEDGGEMADLIQRGLVTRNGLTTFELEVFQAALKSQCEARRTEAA